jgi:phage replication initiation protein
VSVVSRTLESILGVALITKLGPGLMGYATRYVLMVREGNRLTTIGAFCEGEAQRDRNLLQLNSRGCAMFAGKWASMYAWLMTVRVRITRIDLAVDFYQGEHDVDEGVELYDTGAFAVRGRQPKSSLAGDWLRGEDGRTFYVGRRVSGKLLRIYEKGRQLGDLRSRWVRWELQLGNKERDLPPGILTDPDAYFAGAYPALQHILPAASISLPTRAIERATHLAHRLHHLRESYGATLDEALSLKGATPFSVVSALRRARPGPAEALSATWQEVLASLERR